MIDKKAFRSLTCGLYIIGAQCDELRAGCVVNTVLQVTSSPAQLLVAINKDNATAGVVERSGRFTAVCLGESAPMELIGTFGFKTSTEVDKFGACSFAVDAAGVPYVSEYAVARFSARVMSVVDAGTHLLFIGEVEESEVVGSEAPMTYAYYHLVKGGKTPPKASSYEGAAVEGAPGAADGTAEGAAARAGVADAGGADAAGASNAAGEGAPIAADDAEAAPRYAWRCTVCGHIEYGDELPDGFECPVCGVGCELFERVPASDL